MNPPVFVPYVDRYRPDCPAEEAARRIYDCMCKRRSVRQFSERPVSRATLEWLVRTAGSAPSGANKQPWRFVCVSDPVVKRQIRMAAEEVEQAFYRKRAHPQWLADLAPLGTDEHKMFLETAPWLVAVFRLTRCDDGSPVYYGHESVGIAVGMFLAAAHQAGLATLTHTPSPMAFLGRILGRPKHERPYLLIPVGYPADDCQVPAAAVCKKPLAQIMVVVDT